MHSPVLILFDIDGTLTTGGPARAAFQLALEETYGTAGPIATHDFSGKTDPRITRELLTAAGRRPRDIEAGLPRFWTRYLCELEARIDGHPVTVLPGVHELIAALAAREDVHLGLVTGNVAGGARLKLLSARLWHHFPVGGFGSDHEVRNELPRVALDRASVHWGRAFRGSDAVIVGDTPRDVACGKAVGATTVAVATGRFTRTQLLDTEADRVLPDLADTTAAIEALTAPTPLNSPPHDT
ncbi:MAG: haloacid dehalogenase-like hydrolase [Gemmatimonadetes bacterium]|nr:haloacid dehalogenase-like hydrolase [Gemmatimonadota bacterium]MCY3677299.1 haloacid dehalogenase-like hydrolase [Gemmatimonadota bacterium]MYA42405.1 HAD hydrolase-like protein [Gemmatimonadota bacterium]MYE94340.1 HAD hydrolase-like protein [Gemmatimonadota bacterium]MYJ12148.1 HAD hydrolase-like protein [Gemmatimonadota bacterium]